MDELLEDGMWRALRVLYALGKREPLNFGQFIAASGHGRPYAIRLREEMERRGYVTIRELSGHGNAGVLEIKLTPLGRRLADLLIQMEAELLKERALAGDPRGASELSR